VDDERLAEQLKRGDRGALTRLVERHYDALMGYLYRLTYGDRALAQDLVQEAFLRVLRGIDGYEYPRPFKPWLYAIATNLARNHYASADQRRTRSADGDDLPGGDLPDDQLQARDEQQAVIAALRQLPDLHREVIILAYYQSLSLAEIAETLKIPLGTVKSRLSNGVARLREKLKQDETV
jgi:RNA polymerase sigma-70 factor (ECF subfamily)